VDEVPPAGDVTGAIRRTTATVVVPKQGRQGVGKVFPARDLTGAQRKGLAGGPPHELLQLPPRIVGLPHPDEKLCPGETGLLDRPGRQVAVGISKH